MDSAEYKLIYFFGPDGTGKTTHAELTSFYLKRKGYRTWRTRVKQHHTLSYLFLKLLICKNPREPRMNALALDGRLVQRIKGTWKILELISLIPAVIYRVLLPLLLGYVVICDRYVLDTLVALSYFLGEPEMISRKSARLLINLIPENSLLIHLDADTDIILQRKKDEPLTEQLIKYYKKAYRDILRRFGLVAMTIDTSIATIDDVQEAILSHKAKVCSG